MENNGDALGLCCMEEAPVLYGYGFAVGTMENTDGDVAVLISITHGKHVCANWPLSIEMLDAMVDALTRLRCNVTFSNEPEHVVPTSH